MGRGVEIGQSACRPLAFTREVVDSKRQFAFAATTSSVGSHWRAKEETGVKVQTSFEHVTYGYKLTVKVATIRVVQTSPQ